MPCPVATGSVAGCNSCLNAEQVTSSALRQAAQLASNKSALAQEQTQAHQQAPPAEAVQVTTAKAALMVVRTAAGPSHSRTQADCTSKLALRLPVQQAPPKAAVQAELQTLAQMGLRPKKKRGQTL